MLQKIGRFFAGKTVRVRGCRRWIGCGHGILSVRGKSDGVNSAFFAVKSIFTLIRVWPRAIRNRVQRHTTRPQVVAVRKDPTFSCQMAGGSNTFSPMLSAKPWRAEAVIRFCAAQFMCLCLGMAAAGLLQKIGVSGFKSPEDSGNIVLGTLCFQGATCVLIPIFLRQHQLGWREAFGLRGPKLNRALLLAVILVIVILPIAWLLQNVSASALTRLGWPPADQTAVALMAAAKSPWLEIYLGVFTVVLAPVAEEFIFRGMLFPLVRQLGYPRLAWFGISALFALIHFDLAIFLPLFALALALTWLYEKTDNLLAPVAAHSLFNAANLVVLHFEDQLNQLLQKFYHFLHLT